MRPKSVEKVPSLCKPNSGSRITIPKPEVGDTAVKKKLNDVNNMDDTGVHKEGDGVQIYRKGSNNMNDCPDEAVTILNCLSQGKINCRLCDKDITGKECQLLYDQEENVETRLGRKINIIINSTETQLNLSPYCCSVCTSKIEICFSLLVEIQASDEVIKQTYGNFSNDTPVDTSTQLFICGECKSTITGIKSFIRHYENHILKKTVINSRSDVKVSQLIPQCVIDDVVIEEVAEDCDVAENDRVTNNELEDMEKNQEKETGEMCETVDENLYANQEPYTPKSEQVEGNEQDGVESVEKEDVSDSEMSVSSDASYNRLVSIIKRELDKPDSDEEHNIDVTCNEQGQYVCNSCDIVFEYKFLLVHHIAKDHKWKGLEDESDSEFLKMESDEEEENCSECQELIPVSLMELHLKHCRGKFLYQGKVLCHECGKVCSQKQWVIHKRKHQNEKWTCELCGKKFKAKRILKSHLGEHDESKKKVCEICGKKLLPLSFFSHMMKHKEKRHVCQLCGKAFTYNYGLKMHLKVHEGAERIDSKPGKKSDEVVCWLCKAEFDSSIALHRHLKSKHNINGMEQDSRFSCSVCDKKFADMFSLKAHLKLIHEMKDEDIARLKSLPVYRYIECNVCNQVFNSENKVRIHMKRDHGLKPFEMEILKKECEKCGKRFASKQNLIHHINGAHLNIKPMQCDICNERFAKHSSLIYHKLRHSGEKPFQCEFCLKTYRQRNDVIRHLARHVRDQEITLEEASAINNSPSPLVLKRRIFLRDSSISYQAMVSRNKRQKSERVEVDPTPVSDANVEYDDAGSLIYVEEVMTDEVQQPESPSGNNYMAVKPVYDEERNTIILSSSELFKNSGENGNYRYIMHNGTDLPAIYVGKEMEV